jgi:threonine/homoserine efflux transporter RhtA
VGAHFLGAFGVAIGTLIGSIVSVAFHFFYNMPRTSAIAIDRPLLVRDGLLRPLACAIPLALVMVLHFLVPQMTLAILLSLAVVATAISLFLLWNYGLLSTERSRLQSALRIA